MAGSSVSTGRQSQQKFGMIVWVQAGNSYDGTALGVALSWTRYVVVWIVVGALNVLISDLNAC